MITSQQQVEQTIEEIYNFYRNAGSNERKKFNKSFVYKNFNLNSNTSQEIFRRIKEKGVVLSILKEKVSSKLWEKGDINQLYYPPVKPVTIKKSPLGNQRRGATLSTDDINALMDKVKSEVKNIYNGNLTEEQAISNLKARNTVIKSYENAYDFEDDIILETKVEPQGKKVKDFAKEVNAELGTDKNIF